MEALLFGGVLALGAFIIIAAYAVKVVALWPIFKKAGIEGWKSLIPFYNDYILIEIAGLNWWWFLISLAPTVLTLIGIDLSILTTIINGVVGFCVIYNLSKKFNVANPMVFAICGIFVSNIMLMIIGFDKKYIYNGSAQVDPNSYIGEMMNKNNTNNNNNTQNNTNVAPTAPTTNQEVTPTPETQAQAPVQEQAVQQPNVSNNKVCPNCGASVDASAAFCNSCGQKLQ